jgi:peptide deformylase
LQELIANMLVTMYDARGIGLAAQQVGQPIQVTVIDVREASAERPSTLEINGESVDVHNHMPMVLIDPEITPIGEPVSGAEGCLSFPEMYADILRPGLVDVVAMNEKGRRVSFRCGGLLARAVQHETDHLNGILFIDRMDSAVKRSMKPELDELHAATREALES